jgi:hypothetical protein
MELGGLRMRLRSIGGAFAIVALVVVFTACSKDGTGDGTATLASPATGSSITGGSVTKWLGVLRTDADVDALDADTAAVMAVVDGSIVVSPVACFDGLPASFELAAYVLGVVAESKELLDRRLDELGRPTIFEGQVRTMCLD